MTSTAAAQLPVEPASPAGIVEAYLTAHMIPDPDKARQYCLPNMQIVFTGGRKMGDPAEATAFNKGRYKWVKKKFERTDVVAGDKPGEDIVYSIGTLYGEWLDGTPFAGNRYVDRYVLRGGKIAQMQVWNDSAEILLVRAGLATM